jgi:hypothetical protein
MAALRHATSQRDFGKMQSADLELVKADRSCEDVDDRIGGADFVKMDFLHRHAVYLSLDLGQAVEDLDTGCFHLGCQVACFDELANLLPGAWRLIVGRRYLKLRRSDRVNRFLCNIELEIECRDCPQFSTKNFDGQPELHKRGDEHIATYSADQITICNAHHFYPEFMHGKSPISSR